MNYAISECFELFSYLAEKRTFSLRCTMLYGWINKNLGYNSRNIKPWYPSCATKDKERFIYFIFWYYVRYNVLVALSR